MTEVVSKKPEGVPAQRLTGGRIAPAPSTRGGVPARPLPDGPVAAPAKPASTVESRVVVAVRPMGRVAFDGQTLPLVSPDGRFLATQVGEAPAWSSVFAGFTRAPVVPRSTVHLYDLTGEAARRINVAPPASVLLGRDADDAGVLVESAQSDGSRWIGRLSWDGGVEWLVQDRAVNSHAVFVPGGGLAYTRREVDAAHGALVVRSAAGDEWTRRPEAGVGYAFPLVDPSGAFVLVFAVGSVGGGGGRAGVEAIVFALGADLGSAEPVSRRALSSSDDVALAYQAVASVQPSASGSGSNVGPSQNAFLFLHPGLGRMCLLGMTDGAVTPLAERSVAGLFDAGTGGYFLSTPRGLVHQRLNPGEGAATLPEARVLAESWVPRATTSERSPFVLLGPVAGREAELAVTAMQVLPPEQSAR